MKLEKGFALIEVLVAIVVILILIAAVTPSVLASIQAGHESTAAQNLRQFAKAESDYQTLYPNIGFAASAAYLGGPTNGTHCPSILDPNGTWSCEMPDAIAQAMANGTAVTGYKYTYTGGGGSWAMQAIPSSTSSGRKSFCADSSGAIYFSVSPTAPPLIAGTNSCDPSQGTLVGLSF